MSDLNIVIDNIEEGYVQFDVSLCKGDSTLMTVSLGAQISEEDLPLLESGEECSFRCVQKYHRLTFEDGELLKYGESGQPEVSLLFTRENRQMLADRIRGYIEYSNE